MSYFKELAFEPQIEIQINVYCNILIPVLRKVATQPTSH